ncbi:MAG: A/G-specific adenine glycosylase [Cytophagaceae bacterium]|nr:A/G-specific adenine glycosylase [Cytophagaceae bacterium]
MNSDLFAQKLLRWYQRHRRDLPWRQTTDPYFIWLSEIILQQTRVAQGLPYYEKFIGAFPTVQALANADEREVLRLWQGLGYYSRARNLHQTAKSIAGQHEGRFPTSYNELLKLKGIGSYTAAAVASFAFGERVAVLDGNVFRVLARVFGVETDITTTAAKKEFTQLANGLISPDHPAIYNHAIMDFGATQCVPVSPQCLFCPFAFDCEANATGRQAVLPVKRKKAPVRERFFHYFVVQQGDRLLLRERTSRDVWQGLYDFYLVEADQTLSFDELVTDDFLAKIRPVFVLEGASEESVQLLSHQRIRARFWRLRIPLEVLVDLPAQARMVTESQADALPKPLLIVNYLRDDLFRNR